MPHETLIEERTGVNVLTLKGKTRTITASKDASLSGSEATGKIRGRTANIKVSEERFTDLSTRPPQFVVVIEANSEDVSTCDTEAA